MDLVHWIRIIPFVIVIFRENLSEEITNTDNGIREQTDVGNETLRQWNPDAGLTPMASTNTYPKTGTADGYTKQPSHPSTTNVPPPATPSVSPAASLVPLAKQVVQVVEVLVSDPGIPHRDNRQGNDFEEEPENNNTDINSSGEAIKGGGKTKVVVETRVEAQNREGEMACEGNRGVLMHIFKHSKFFASAIPKTWEQAKDLCEDNQLALAEVQTIVDYQSLQYFISYQFSAHAFRASDSKYYIGLNDRVTEGVYLQADGKNATFQTYHSSQPDDDDMNEDCTALGKETYEGPLGMSDEDCTKRFRVLCMFPKDSHCLNDTAEAKAKYKLLKQRGLVPFTNISSRSYYVSNFQLTWKDALSYCVNQSMILFDMDDIVNKHFFDSLFEWETTIINDNIPTIQYWTSGRFQDTHMNAEVYWHTNELKHSPQQEYGTRKNFTFSGIFMWSWKKKRDPGGPHGWRKDLCLSFGFESKPDSTPFVRNTNCGIPAYFICSLRGNDTSHNESE